MFYAAGALLLCLSWLQPLHLLPWMSWHSEVPAFLAVLFLAGAVIHRHWKQKIHHLRFPIAGLMLALMIVVVLFQTAVGLIPFFGDGLIVLLYLSLSLMAIAIGFDVVNWARPKTDTFFTYSAIGYLACCFLVAAVCSVLLCFAQSFDVWPTAGWIVHPPSLRRPGANLGQPNQLATLLLMSIASLAYLFESKKCSKSFAASILALLVFGLALTESRSGLLSFLLLVFWWFARRRSAGFSATPVVALSAGVGLLALLLAWPPFFAGVQEGGWTGGIYDTQLNVSAGTRLVVWPQLIEAVLQRPWFGWGLREVSTAHNAVLSSYASGEPFTYAHNIVLDLAVGMGLPLTIALVGIVLVWAWRRLHKCATLLPWYCIALILPMGVHSMLEFPFAYAYLLAPVMFAIGVLERISFPTRVILVPSWVALSGLLLVGFTMTLSVIEYVKIEEDFRIARFEALRIGKTPADYQRPQVHLLTQLDALLEGSRVVPSPGMSLERIELSRKVAMRFPWTAVQNRYALSLALNGHRAEAIRQLKVMRAMHGEKMFEGVVSNWNELGDSKYPELKEVVDQASRR